MNPTTARLKKFAALLKEWCIDDWEAKLVALVLAFLVWYIVRDKLAKNNKFTPPDGWNTRPTTFERSQRAAFDAVPHLC